MWRVSWDGLVYNLNVMYISIWYFKIMIMVLEFLLFGMVSQVGFKGFNDQWVCIMLCFLYLLAIHLFVYFYMNIYHPFIVSFFNIQKNLILSRDRSVLRELQKWTVVINLINWEYVVQHGTSRIFLIGMITSQGWLILRRIWLAKSFNIPNILEYEKDPWYLFHDTWLVHIFLLFVQ